MHNHNDNAAEVDYLDQAAFISQISDAIKNSIPPKGIAINGYWGTGKTSALILLHKKLTGVLPTESYKNENKEIMTVWFEAWRYQNETQPIVALLQEIRKNFTIWNSFLDKSEKLSGILLQGVIGAFDEVLKNASGGFMSPSLGKIPKIAEKWEKDHYETPLTSQDLTKLMEEAIEKALGNNERKLVIFIDDLDRCMPETALKLLEGIKLYLNLKQCIIVFGMDQRQIENSLHIALKIKDNLNDSDDHAREYLEKICQDIFHLPIIDQTKKKNYLISLLRDLELNDYHIDELEKCLNVFDCLPANPRKIKSLANRLAFMLKRLENLTSDINKFHIQNLNRFHGILICVAIIYTFHRRLNEQLAKNPIYINHVIIFARKPLSNISDKMFEPMATIKPSMNEDTELPTNPSDSNVFRLHALLIELDTISIDEIKPLLNL